MCSRIANYSQKCKFIVLLLLLLFNFIIPANAKSNKKYTIDIQCEKDEYELQEKCIFDIEIKGTKTRKKLKHLYIVSTYPDETKVVKLNKKSKNKFQYQTDELTSIGEKTLTVSIYHKRTKFRLQALERKRHNLFSLIHNYQNMMIRFPHLRHIFLRLINITSSLISKIEKLIEKLKIPIISNSKTIIVNDNIDNEPPVIEQLDNISIEATGLLSEIVLPAPIVTDNKDPNPVITCDAPDSYPLNDTIVTWTATDSSNNTSSSKITVNVADTTPPIILVENTYSLEGTGTLTTVDLSSISANDIVDQNPTLSLDPSSNQFLWGDTIVTFTATDFAGRSHYPGLVSGGCLHSRYWQ